jgi:hypothetical protein
MSEELVENEKDKIAGLLRYSGNMARKETCSHKWKIFNDENLYAGYMTVKCEKCGETKEVQIATGG